MKTTATVKYRGAAIPDGWELVDDALLLGRFGRSSQMVRRLAGFDFDDTLSPLDWGKPDAWSHLYGHAPRVIRQLHADGHAVAVLSNECLDRYKPVHKSWPPRHRREHPTHWLICAQVQAPRLFGEEDARQVF